MVFGGIIEKMLYLIPPYYVIFTGVYDPDRTWRPASLENMQGQMVEHPVEILNVVTSSDAVSAVIRIP